MGKLVIIPTIGNLDDITFRAVKMLNECQLVYAEDTRVTKKLLNHLNIQNHVVPFHAHNEHRVLEKCIESIKSNELTGLVSDAGTPGISDPGYLLIGLVLRKKLRWSVCRVQRRLYPHLLLLDSLLNDFISKVFTS